MSGPRRISDREIPLSLTGYFMPTREANVPLLIGMPDTDDLTFLLDEFLSPQVLAQVIAEACGGSALKAGEAIRVDHAKIACVVTYDRPSFGWQWQQSSEEPVRLKLKRNTCK